jgi:hypothetical protein
MALCCAAAAARAELTCEQLAMIGQTAVQLRDQGVSLSRVLADARREDMRQRFSEAELNVIGRAAQLAYTGEASPAEILQACVDGRASAPRR